MKYTAFIMEKGSRKIVLPVIIEQDDNGIYIGSVPTLQGCQTQGATLPELYERLEEAVSLYLEVMDERHESGASSSQNRLISVQQMEFAY